MSVRARIDALFEATIRDHVLATLLANPDEIDRDRLLLAGRYGILPQIAEEHGDLDLDEDDWRDAWVAMAEAGHALPTFEREEDESSFSASYEEGTYEVPMVTTRWSALGNQHEVTIAGDYGGEHGGQQYGWGGERHDQWGTYESREGDTTSAMVRGLVMAHGASDPEEDASGPEEPSAEDIDISGRPDESDTVTVLYPEDDGSVSVVEVTLGQWRHQHGHPDYAPSKWTTEEMPGMPEEGFETKDALMAQIQEVLAEREQRLLPGLPWLTPGKESPTLFERDAATVLANWLLANRELPPVPYNGEVQAGEDPLDDPVLSFPTGLELPLRLDDIEIALAHGDWDYVLKDRLGHKLGDPRLPRGLAAQFMRDKIGGTPLG